MKTIRVGSRDSRLAVVQSELVIAAIRAAEPERTVELVTMKTTGDKILDRTLDQIGGKGLFVKELDAALLDGRVDLTVHSAKDLPMELTEGLPLAAFSRREDPRDALVLPEGAAELDLSKPLGCTSLRRKMQLEQLFPGAAVAPVRGNVQTRLRKLDEGQFSALILASAGLRRLGLEHRISRLFSTEEILPAAGQGILAVQARSGEDVSFLHAFNDEDGRDCLTAERAFVRTLDGGCTSPVAAHAVLAGDQLILDGFNLRGERDRIRGSRQDAEKLGIELAQRMK
ncbi:MAG: hydroxymethylbilane synthase [Oscillospiraceae bacterium]|nr:hydroxymethylbilane synthase [Oscillospiraceae bacterium]